MFQRNKAMTITATLLLGGALLSACTKGEDTGAPTDGGSAARRWWPRRAPAARAARCSRTAARRSS
ncbi:hypothetical protein ACFQZ4_11660 [Catellatospora coxensis]